MAASTTTVVKSGEESGGFLSRIPWYYQMLILLALVALVIFGVDLALYSDKRAKTEQTLQQVEALKKKNQQGEIIRANLVAAEETLKQKNKEIEQLRELLPDQVEITNVFGQIESLMKKDSLLLRSFQEGKAAPADYYTAQPMQYTIYGTYDNIGKFFSDLGFFTRIVSVSDVNIKEAGKIEQERGFTVEGIFTVTAYYLSKENLEKLTAKKAGEAPADAKKSPQKGKAPAEKPK